MDITHTPHYRKAFIRYLRRGVPIDVSLKADEHPTKYYIWHTQGDEKVRPSHAANDGKVFAWKNPPETGNPGEEYGCRCWAEPYSGDAIEPVYPELLIIPLLRIGRLAEAWRAWILSRRTSKEWRLGDYKSPGRWAKQLKEGGWTPEKITNTIKNGERYKAENRIRGGTPATRYQLGDDFVVLDNETNEIIQVSRPNPGGFHPIDFKGTYD
jgi:hypothetical protein